jgi:hypothetical protein
MVSLITLPSSFLEYPAFIASANDLRLGTSTIRKDEEQLYQHTLHRNSGKQIAIISKIQTHVNSFVL